MKQVFIFFIRFYQRFISPMLPPRCRYLPTCSNYAIQAFQNYGACKGLILSLKRIMKCHPWGPFGWDPVPQKESKKCCKHT